MTDEPTYISGNDIPVGSEVKWYHGGILRSEERIVTANEAANGLLLLAHPAEYGSVVGTVNGTPTLLKQLTPTDAPATDATGTGAVAYSNMTSGDRLSIDYLDTKSAPLKHIATGTGVSTGLVLDTREEAVDGRLYKHRRTGTATRTATLEELWYSDALLAAFFGDLLVSETDGSLWTDEFQTSKIVPAIVGKWVQNGEVRKKYFLLSCQSASAAQTLATETYYTNRFDLLVENLRIYTPVGVGEMTIDIKDVTITTAKSWNGQRIYDVTIEGDVKQVRSGTAGEDLNAYDCAYLETNIRWYKTNASTDAKSDGILAIVLANTVNGADGQFQTAGPITSPAWLWVPGRPIYLAATPGGLTQTAPVTPGSQVRVVGYAIGAQTIMLAPDSTVLEV
jgi:hypothetical protein